LPLPAALALAALSGVLCGLCFPPTRWRLLAWVGLAPFLLALRGAAIRRALGVGLVWDLTMCWITAEWMPRAVANYFEQPSAVGFAFWLFSALTMSAPYYLAFAAVYPSLVRRCGVSAPLFTAAAWTAVELARGRLFNGTVLYFGSAPWATLGYSQVGVEAIVQIAAVTGVYGISFALVAVNAALVDAAATLRDRPRSPARPAASLALGCAPALLAAAYGFWSLAGAPDPRDVPDGTPVAVVQGNVPLETRWRSDLWGRNLATYLRLTRAAARGERPEVIFWPEAAMTFFLESQPPYQREIARTLQPIGAQLVAGAPRTDDAPRPTYWNSIYLLGPNGTILDRYDKQHRVPFMEYFPLGIDLLRRRFGAIREFAAAPPSGPLRTRAGAAGVLLCNEALLPHFAAQRVDEGAEYLVNPSNDSWVPQAKFTGQMFDLVALRAIEQRRWLVRASTSGPSAIVDPWGRVQVASEPFAAEVLKGRIRRRSGRSLYGHLGDLFSVVCALAVVAALLAPVRPPRRAA